MIKNLGEIENLSKNIAGVVILLRFVYWIIRQFCLKGDLNKHEKRNGFQSNNSETKGKRVQGIKIHCKKTGQSLSATVRNVIIYDIIRYAEKTMH